MPLTPAQLFPGLFQAVSEAGLFADSKLFADALPRRDAAAIMAGYRALATADVATLRAFVRENFTLPAAADAPAARTGLPLRAHIAATWDRLVRAPVAEAGSTLAIAHFHVVPGGRFREPYYWDSYFTLLGLARDRPALARSTVDVLADLALRFGHFPNGARSYYIGRSQPPVFALMLDLVSPATTVQADRWLEAALVEHRFWTVPPRAVALAGGAVLARYWDEGGGPREESWREDVAVAAAAGSRRPRDDVWRDLRAAAESGWDFSSRWLGDGGRLETIRTTRIVPVDLNALLLASERSLAERCRHAGRGPEAAALDTSADARRRAIDRHCWRQAAGCYGDHDLDTGGPTGHLSAATLFPLFAGIASQAQADAVADVAERLLLAPGGLRTTRIDSGQQWDAPNGWAPLQWIAVQGLRRYGHAALARRIAGAWLATVEGHYRRTGVLLEKYDIEAGTGGGRGGEYPVQTGFGWTNGVCAALLDEAAELEPVPR